MARGLPAPGWVDERPDIAEGDEFFLRAFWDLSTERQIGMAMGPIPASKIDEYAHRKGLDSDNMDLFRVVIRLMDDAYLTWASEQQERARSKSRG